MLRGLNTMATEQYASPSRDPANDDSLLGMARQILDKFLSQIDDMLPARVISYDRAANRATVVPMVKLLTTDNRQIGRAQIASIPVLRLGGGGAMLSFNIKAGDFGWVKANDRDISLITQGYKDSAPNTLRKHSFQDALFIPDEMTGVTIAEEDVEHAVLQAIDGSVRLALWPEFIKVLASRGLFVSSEAGEPSQNTLFDVHSLLKASRPWPQMTTAQRDAIPATPEDEGAAVWLLDAHRLSTYNGSAWS